MVVMLTKASIIVTILWAFYKLFLEKESFFGANRIYLLGCLFLAFALPFVSLPKLVDDQGFISAMIERTGTSASESPSIAVVSPGSTQPDPGSRIDGSAERQTGLSDWLLWLYYFGVSVLSVNLLVQVAGLSVKAGKSENKVKDVDGVIINSASVQEPCSFFNYIFINPERYDYVTYEQILSHEKIHVKKRHTIDLLLAEIAVVVLWFNPFVWFLRKEVERNMEYETDDLMLSGKAVEKEQYQMNLIKISTYRKPLAITTNYNQSLIKQRIFRMNAKKSSPHNYWKYAFACPLVLAMLLVINKPVSAFAGSAGSSVAMDPGERNGPYSADCQALLTAVKRGDVEKVRELLKTVDPDCSYRGDGEPRSPLVAAARSGHLPIGRLLVNAGADVEFHAPGDETPLIAASAHGHLEFAEFLVANSAKINRTLGGDGSALLVAAREGHLEIVEYLISQGADVNSQVDRDGTPLICAVRNNHYEISKILLENGADPYQVSPGDEYAMFHARMSGNRSIIDLLKKYEKEN